MSSAYVNLDGRKKQVYITIYIVLAEYIIAFISFFVTTTLCLKKTRQL